MHILLRGLPLLALSLLASAQEPGLERPHGPGMERHGGPRKGSPLLRHAKELGLTEEQITRLKAQAEARKDSLRQLHEAHREAMRALHEGESEVAKQKAQAAGEALKAAMDKARAEDLAVLTPEQQEKAKALKEKFSGPKGGPGRRPER